jgi:hypothetical protein
MSRGGGDNKEDDDDVVISANETKEMKNYKRIESRKTQIKQNKPKPLPHRTWPACAPSTMALASVK